MARTRPSAARKPVEPPADVVRSACVPALPTPQASSDFAVASHTALFATERESRCDACGCTLELDAAESDEWPSRGVYVWARGQQVRLEHVPLCVGCATGIGATVRARWEIEEEEG
jgi:hypothetical protein